jgi:hypothetical protein
VDRYYSQVFWPFQSSPYLRTPTAIGRVTVKSPADMRSLAILNAGKKYADQLKPFNFLLTCHVKQFRHPPGADPERFHLIAPYELDPRGWLEMPWVDRYTGKPYRITTEGFRGTRLAARVKTYGEVLREYEFHPGSKSADVSGKPCGKQTIGLLQRRHIRVARIIYIGQQPRRGGIWHNPSISECLHGISRPAARRMGIKNITSCWRDRV